METPSYNKDRLVYIVKEYLLCEQDPSTLQMFLYSVGMIVSILRQNLDGSVLFHSCKGYCCIHSFTFHFNCYVASQVSKNCPVLLYHNCVVSIQSLYVCKYHRIVLIISQKLVFVCTVATIQCSCQVVASLQYVLKH